MERFKLNVQFLGDNEYVVKIYDNDKGAWLGTSRGAILYSGKNISASGVKYAIVRDFSRISYNDNVKPLSLDEEKELLDKIKLEAISYCVKKSENGKLTKRWFNRTIKPVMVEFLEYLKKEGILGSELYLVKNVRISKIVLENGKEVDIDNHLCHALIKRNDGAKYLTSFLGVKCLIDSFVNEFMENPNVRKLISIISKEIGEKIDIEKFIYEVNLFLKTIAFATLYIDSEDNPPIVEFINNGKKHEIYGWGREVFYKISEKDVKRYVRNITIEKLAEHVTGKFRRMISNKYNLKFS